MSQYLRRMKRLTDADKFSDLLQTLEYWEDEECFLCDGPRLALWFSCQPSTGVSDELRHALTNLYNNSFPPDTLIQASLVSSPDIEDMLYGFGSIRGNRNVGVNNEQSNAIGRAIQSFMREGTQRPINEAGTLLRNYEFWFVISIPIKQIEPTEKELKTLRSIRKIAKGALDGFHPEAVNEAGYLRRMRVLCNMFAKKGWRQKPSFQESLYSSRPLREEVLEPGSRVEVDKHQVKFQDQATNTRQIMRTYWVKDLPEHMVYGQMLNYLGDWRFGQKGALSEHFMLTLNVMLPDQFEAKRSFGARRTFVGSQARGPIIQRLDRLRFQNKDFNDTNREIEQEGSGLAQFSLSILGVTPNEERAEEFSQTLTSFLERENVQIVQDSYFTLPNLIAHLPMGLSPEYVKNSGRFNFCTTKALTFMTPHIASWKGVTYRPVMMMVSRLGQVVGIDPFESDTNYNMFIAAASGSGKSFLSAYLINCLLGSGVKKQAAPHADFDKQEVFDDGAQVFTIDVGGSYLGIAKQFTDSQYLVFDNNFPYSLNPFLYVHDFTGKAGEEGEESTDGQGIMVLNQIKAMAAPSGQISDLQHHEMLSMLNALWEKKQKNATIDDFVEMCEAHDRQELRDIGVQLKTFCHGSFYGNYFHKDKPPINFKSRFIGLELEALKGDTHLQVIVLMSVIMSIQQAMFLGDMDRRKALLLDEAWEWLKDNPMFTFVSAFLEAGFRRFRKYNAAGIVITQSIQDGYQSQTGRAIMENSAWKFILGQKDDAIDQLKENKRYSGNARDFELMKSVHTRRPRPNSTEAYSESLIDIDGTKQVCRLYTDRRTQLLLTTRADEKTHREAWIRKGYSLLEAVDKMLEEEQSQNQLRAG